MRVWVNLTVLVELPASWKCETLDGEMVIIPQSQVFEPNDVAVGQSVTMLVPKWLAKKQGLEYEEQHAAG